MVSGSVLTERLIAEASAVVAGKAAQIRLLWVALLCGGHVLLEDLPGVGKTTLAQTLARLLGLSYQRVQFTADMLPSDIIGAQLYDKEKQQFRFHRGPIFTQLLLADELNRATPKAQSALLEAMEERQISIDGKTLPLPDDFFVIATQNPQTQSGTYPLPESQLDRFFMRLSLGYPPPAVERQLLIGSVGRSQLARLQPIIQTDAFQQIKAAVPQIKMSDAVLDYIIRLVGQSRDSAVCALGLSPRAATALARAAQALALISGRGYVIPDDVQTVFASIASHRIKPLRAQTAQQLVEQILASVDVIGDP